MGTSALNLYGGRQKKIVARVRGGAFWGSRTKKRTREYSGQKDKGGTKEWVTPNPVVLHSFRTARVNEGRVKHMKGATRLHM